MLLFTRIIGHVFYLRIYFSSSKTSINKLLERNSFSQNSALSNKLSNSDFYVISIIMTSSSLLKLGLMILGQLLVSSQYQFQLKNIVRREKTLVVWVFVLKQNYKKASNTFLRVHIISGVN